MAGGRIIRRRRSTWGAVAALVSVVVLAGCGGHSNGNAAGGAPNTGSNGSPAALKALKVVSIEPKKLSGTASITVKFASPLSPQSPLPTLTPDVPGQWLRQGAAAVFTPSGAYPPDSTVAVNLAKKPGAKVKTIATRATPSGSLLRAEQILARLHYLPITTTAVTPTTGAEEAAAVYSPPAGTFGWRFADVPATLKKDWSPGKYGNVVRGAIIAFQHQANLPLDGTIGRHTWHALLKADLANQLDPDKYSFVSANLYLPQTLSVWVNGHTVLTSPVNGGVAGAPTPLGTFPVYERFTATTMQGTNPDGTKYNDPGVPWVNYFSGGSAVHGFPRASYGFPQSVGCLELPIPTAGTVFKLIDYGTLVNVAGPFVPPPSVATPGPPASPSPSATPTHKPSSKPSSSPKPTVTPSTRHSKPA
jgi:peptidoglycan hydrolase-like protein with peptidoglycan-binding domain